jgi:hypothetical protein
MRLLRRINDGFIYRTHKGYGLCSCIKEEQETDDHSSEVGPFLTPCFYGNGEVLLEGTVFVPRGVASH